MDQGLFDYLVRPGMHGAAVLLTVLVVALPSRVGIVLAAVIGVAHLACAAILDVPGIAVGAGALAAALAVQSKLDRRLRPLFAVGMLGLTGAALAGATWRVLAREDLGLGWVAEERCESQALPAATFDAAALWEWGQVFEYGGAQPFFAELVAMGIREDALPRDRAGSAYSASGDLGILCDRSSCLLLSAENLEQVDRDGEGAPTRLIGYRASLGPRTSFAMIPDSAELIVHDPSRGTLEILDRELTTLARRADGFAGLDVLLRTSESVVYAIAERDGVATVKAFSPDLSTAHATTDCSKRS
jgi:hypothetical protein